MGQAKAPEPERGTACRECQNLIEPPAVIPAAPPMPPINFPAEMPLHQRLAIRKQAEAQWQQQWRREQEQFRCAAVKGGVYQSMDGVWIQRFQAPIATVNTNGQCPYFKPKLATGAN